MKVFKFGGDSIGNMDRIARAGDTVKNYSGEKVLIVISAMGKTSHSLEKVAEAFCNGRREEALALFEVVKKHFLTLANYLLVKEYNGAYPRLLDIFTEVEWLLHDRPVKGPAYYHDQIVCSGELLTSALISAYFNEAGIQNVWVDIRDIFRTDDHFGNAAIDWSFTRERVNTAIAPLFNDSDIVVTQGAVGATAENESTTLGPDGGDHSAGVFANMLQASELLIWEDTEGVTKPIPKRFP